MSFLGRLFGAPEATKEAVAAVKDGLDAIWYTDEEKAHDAAADRSEARKVLLEWVKNSQGQNLSRRVLAFMIGAPWVAMKLAGAFVGIAGVWFTEQPEKVTETIRLINEITSDMTPAVMLILGFYFAGPYMGRIAESALVKFGDRNTKND